MPPKRKAGAKRATATKRAPVKARSTKKIAAKKPAAKKPAAKKPAARTPAPTKPAARKAAPKSPEKPAARKAAPKSSPRAEAPSRIRVSNVPPPVDDSPLADEIPPEEPWQFGGAPRGSAPGPEEPPKVSPFQPGFAPECMACPIGLVFFALKNTKPEVMEHVMKAGFEMFQAVRALMEQYNDRWEQGQTLQRIPIS